MVAADFFRRRQFQKFAVNNSDAATRKLVAASSHITLSGIWPRHAIAWRGLFAHTGKGGGAQDLNAFFPFSLFQGYKNKKMHAIVACRLSAFLCFPGWHGKET